MGNSVAATSNAKTILFTVTEHTGLEVISSRFRPKSSGVVAKRFRHSSPAPLWPSNRHVPDGATMDSQLRRICQFAFNAKLGAKCQQRTSERSPPAPGAGADADREARAYGVLCRRLLETVAARSAPDSQSHRAGRTGGVRVRRRPRPECAKARPSPRSRGWGRQGACYPCRLSRPPPGTGSQPPGHSGRQGRAGSCDGCRSGWVGRGAPPGEDGVRGAAGLPGVRQYLRRHAVLNAPCLGPAVIGGKGGGALAPAGWRPRLLVTKDG